MSNNQIEKKAVLRLPRKQVWQAISDYREFGQWFGIEFENRFEEGALLSGRVTHPGFEHLTAEILVVRVKPQWLLSWRWHPAATDPHKDYTDEPMTLVTFELSDVTGGASLTITESGFNGIPEERREAAFRENEAGWSQQIQSITRYIARVA